MSDDRQREERQRDLESKGTPLQAEETATSRFRLEVAARKAGLDNQEPEENLWSGGYSPKAMIGTWGLLVLLSIALIVLSLSAVIPPFTIGIALLIVLAVWVIAILQYGIRRLGMHYQLTTQRFIHQTGLLTRKTDRIEVIDIDDVSFTQGPVQRIFGVGTIVLTGSDSSHPSLSMLGIADVKTVAGLIDDIRRKERRRRSLHIESN
jgi:uncharacterized membrane protein YdbT with pleckstrin-like domain